MKLMKFTTFLLEAHQPKFNDKTIVAKDVATGRPAIQGLKKFAAGYHPDKKVGWIEVIEAHPKKTGVGREAVGSYEKWVADQGGKEVRGEALPSSVGFWQKMGYTPQKPNNKGRVPISKKIGTED